MITVGGRRRLFIEHLIVQKLVLIEIGQGLRRLLQIELAAPPGVALYCLPQRPMVALKSISLKSNLKNF